MTVIIDEQPGRPAVWFYITPGDERDAAAVGYPAYLAEHVGELDRVTTAIAGERQLDWDEALQILDHYAITDVSLLAAETIAIAAAVKTTHDRITQEQAAA